MVRLKALRLLAGLKQADVAQRACIPGPNVSKIECRRLNPTTHELKRLGAALGADPERLMDDVMLGILEHNMAANLVGV